MAGGTILGAGNPLLWNAGLSAILGGVVGSITSDILDRNQWNELLDYASNNNISSFTLDEDAKDLREYLIETQNLNDVQAGLVINQIRHLGTGFDQLINQIQTANVQLDNAINVMVSDIVSDSDDLTDANRQFIKTVSEMTDIGETYNTAYEDALNNLPAARFWNKTALRQMYAENVGGTYEGGVLRDQNGEQLDLSTGEMRQAIAAAMASDQLEANVNSFVHNLVNSTDEALRAVVEGTANQDQFNDVQNRMNDIASEYRLNLNEFQAYINKINESINTIPPVFLNTFTDIPVQILANLSSSLENASDGEKSAIVQALNEIIKNVSPEVAEKIMAAFATTDFSKITNIDAFFAGLEDLVPGVNLASESLAALRQAAIEAGDATAQLSQTLLTQFASLRDKVANRERNGFTAEDLQTLRENGLDTEALFVQTGEDAFRFIGEFGELSEAISQGYNKVINDQIQSVDSMRERAEEAEQAYLDAQAATQAAQEALDEQTADIETVNKKVQGLADELRNGRFGNIFQILSYEITNGIATILEDLNNIFFGGNENNTFGTWAKALRANNENGSTGYTAYDEARQALEDAQLAEEDAKNAMEVAQGEIKNSLDNGVSAIQQAVASGDFSALHLDEILNDPTLAQAFDNALIGALYEYEDLISLADELRNATDEASRSTARLNAALQLTAKQNQKLYENLAKAITDSADALAGKDVDPAGYKKAIDKIVQAARDAFGDNPIITPKFVEDNLSLFQDFANGSIDAVDSIREALTNQVNGTLELTNDQLSAVQTAMSSLDGASFETEGYMDASQLFTTLANIMGGAEEAANYLRSLGYTIEWKQIGEASLTIPDPNNPGQMITDVLPNYQAIVTDGFGNIANTNHAASLGSGGGGGGGGSKKSWKNPYDELYNLTEDINENLRERNHLEDEYGRIVDRNNKEVAAAYKNNLQARENLYQERRYRDQELAGRRNQLRNIGNRTVETEDGFKTYAEMDVVKYARYNDADNTVEIDWDGIDKIEDTEIGKAVEQYVKDLEELQGQIEDTEDRIIEIDDDLWELEQRGKEEALDM